VLLINFPSLGNNEAGETIRFIFREAKIHDAVRGAQRGAKHAYGSMLWQYAMLCHVTKAVV
jgi:hypothetical protein